MLGMKVELLANMGGYLQLLTPGIPLLGQTMYNGIYKMNAYDFTCTGVFTTTTPTDAYRGAGRPEATFAIERIVDELAVELDMDPLELRRKNWITHEEFPYTTVAGETYDSGNYEAATDRALELFDYDALRAEQRRRRDPSEKVRLGIGISTYTEMCGLAPSRWLASMKYAAGGWEHCTIRVLPTGKVELVTGTAPHGQGHVTSWSQIAGDALGIPLDDIEVLYGDTALAPFGFDTYGSRSLAVGGVAIVKAAQAVIEKGKIIAGHQLEVSPDDLEFVDGAYRVKGDPDTSTTIQTVAWEAFTAHNMPDDVDPNLYADATVDPQVFSFPHGTHLCAVEVDTETGWTSIKSYVAVDDVGVQVNPMIVEGQLHGGITQGIAQALWEGAEYDADGNLLTASLADYLVPGAPDVPTYVLDSTTTPSTTHVLGTKGVGEAGAIASTPAVINAILDALRPLGVRDVVMPASPQTVWRAIQAAAYRGLGAKPAMPGRPRRPRPTAAPREARHDPRVVRLRPPGHPRRGRPGAGLRRRGRQDHHRRAVAPAAAAHAARGAVRARRLRAAARDARHHRRRLGGRRRAGHRRRHDPPRGGDGPARRRARAAAGPDGGDGRGSADPASRHPRRVAGARRSRRRSAHGGAGAGLRSGR